MSQWPSPNDDNLIRITVEEANSPHVDDLIKRQMSLRGETGIARDRKRKWYYQNWFVFMIAGALGAVAGWAIIEPKFDDRLYFQGTIDAMQIHGKLFAKDQAPGEALDPVLAVLDWIEVGGQRFLISPELRAVKPGGGMEPVRASALKLGEPIGLYIGHENMKLPDSNRIPILYVEAIVRNPAPLPADAAPMNFRKASSRQSVVGMLLFPLVAGLIGLAVGGIDGIICRLFRRALLAGGVGLLAGFIGGFVCLFLAGLVYSPLHDKAVDRVTGGSGWSGMGLFLQISGRALAWAVAGMAAGIGQGIALRSSRLTLYGFLGGILGGLLGGLLFDPIALIFTNEDTLSAHWSRLVSLGIIGATVGLMIGVVELLARDAWLRMTEGPLNGKEFLIFKDTMRVGSSPRSDIYLFNDPAVAGQHAVIRSVGENYEIENSCPERPLAVNGRSIQRTRLRHGDVIAIGRTSFVFQQRKG